MDEGAEIEAGAQRCPEFFFFCWPGLRCGLAPGAGLDPTGLAAAGFDPVVFAPAVVLPPLAAVPPPPFEAPPPEPRP